MNKDAQDMDFNEFLRWAQEYTIDEFLNKGISGIKSALHLIIGLAAQNKVFGGKKIK